ncbi:MAG: hypothetical protein ACE5E9_06310 [Nitrospinaceae bacterium]
MDNRKFSLALALTASLYLIVLTGCAGRHNADKASDPAAKFSDVAYPFTDVPVPNGFSVDREKSFIYESGSGKIKVGRLYYSGWNNSQEVVNYYQNVMINKGWKLVNAMEHAGMILNYEKKGWACTLIVTESWFKTHVEIQIGPR